MLLFIGVVFGLVSAIGWVLWVFLFSSVFEKEKS